MCRLMTTQLMEALEGYPLYSQDGKVMKLFAVLFLLLVRFVGSSLKEIKKAMM